MRGDIESETMSSLKTHLASRIEDLFRMIFKALKKGWPYGVAVASFILSVVPESCFQIDISQQLTNEQNIIAARIILCAILVLVAWFINGLILLFKPSVTIKGRNYQIIVQYGDILNEKNGKKVIPFDECFTSKVGPNIEDINPSSLCGQYLRLHPITDAEMQTLLKSSGLEPCRSLSKYKGKPRYEPGSMVLKDSYLLMSFTKLNENGRSSMTYKDYLNCLDRMWASINDIYGQEDVYIPILGAGTTRFEDWNPGPQDLVNVIIKSYELSKNKLKPNKLHIVCRKRNEISLDKIE